MMAGKFPMSAWKRAVGLTRRKPMKAKVNEGLFETLLREFMAGRMSSKQGNSKLRAFGKKCFEYGVVYERYPKDKLETEKSFFKIMGFKP